MITVAICTWNRSRRLAQTLECMTRLLLPGKLEWELIIVNNNCTDDTDSVINRFADRLPIRRVFEVSSGLSHARNAAVREASGDYVLWTDDDVLVDRRWLSEYWKSFKKWPDAAAFGGPVTPWFEGDPPRWLLRVLPQVQGALALRDFGDTVIPLALDKRPFGANFAIRSIEQREHLYDPSLGRRPGSMLSGEETEVVRAILENGGHGWWIPGASVRHFIPKERQTASYLHRFFRGYGEQFGSRMEDRGDAKLFGKSRWLWRRAIEAELRYRSHRLTSPPEVWIEDLKRAAEYWGRLRGFASNEPKTRLTQNRP
jgi:glycosyltransferase involved in cell wall biosynthesis